MKKRTRIKPKEVTDKFLATGLEPAAGAMQGVRCKSSIYDYISSPIEDYMPTCACGIGVLLPVHYGGIRGGDFSRASFILGIDSEYLIYFARGFDGKSLEPLTEYLEVATKQVKAYLDGINSHLETLKVLGHLAVA